MKSLSPISHKAAIVASLGVLLAAAFLLAGLGTPAKGAPATGWEADHRATQDTTGAGQDETAIAANPLDPNNAIAVTKDYRDHVLDTIDATTDGGVTWHEQQFPLPDPTLPEYTDPYVFFRPDGRAYLLWTSSRDFYLSGLFTASSDDGGLTWSPPVAITPPGSYFDDKSWLAFDSTGGPHNGTIYAFWTRFGNAEIESAHSTDGGTTWSAPAQVSNGQSAIYNDGAQPVVMPDGSLYVIFSHDVSTTTGTLTLAISSDGGATFSPNRPLFDVQKPPHTLPGEDWRIFLYHTLVRDPVRGWLTLVWPDYRYGDTNGIDVLYSRSTDNGLTWVDPARLNDDPPGLVRDQMFPMLAVSPDGRLTADWLDRRDDPNNRLYYTYARTSTDGGLTWEPSVRASSAPSDPNLNIPPAADGIGDYIGLSAGPGVVWASWADVRNGNQDIYAARELFTLEPTPTVIESPSPRQTPTATASASPRPTATPCAISFSDVHPSDYFYQAVDYLYCRGAISGYADGTFRPYNNMTRAQFAKVIVLALGWPIDTTGGPHFSDVPPSHPFYCYIETAYHQGIFAGHADGTFRPYNNITRGQISKVVVVAVGWALSQNAPPFSDVPPDNPFYAYIATVYEHGAIAGYSGGTFRPWADATRGQVSRIVYLSLQGP